jgi:hypothetical protein
MTGIIYFTNNMSPSGPGGISGGSPTSKPKPTSIVITEPTITITSIPTVTNAPKPIPTEKPSIVDSGENTNILKHTIHYAINNRGDTNIYVDGEIKFTIFTNKVSRDQIKKYFCGPWIDGESIYFGIAKHSSTNHYPSWCSTSIDGRYLKHGAIYCYTMNMANRSKLRTLMENFEYCLYWDDNKKLFIGIGKSFSDDYDVFILNPNETRPIWTNISSNQNVTLMKYNALGSEIIINNNKININHFITNLKYNEEAIQ